MTTIIIELDRIGLRLHRMAKMLTALSAQAEALAKHTGTLNDKTVANAIETLAKEAFAIGAAENLLTGELQNALAETQQHYHPLTNAINKLLDANWPRKEE